jgi:hypothetical protein
MTVQALQNALAAEHAVIWGYAVVGAKVGADLRGRVDTADAEHRTRRDATATAIRELSADPTPTRSSYAIPFPVTDQTSALRLAVRLEEGACAAWRYVVATAEDIPLRRSALDALTASTLRATSWRGLVTPTTPTVPFPGQTRP